jgi:hypothetical protein
VSFTSIVDSTPGTGTGTPFGIQIHLKRAGPLRDLLPKRQVILDFYYLRQNYSRSSSPHVNAIGMIWDIYY